MSNRILLHLGHGCRCRRAQRQYDALKATCESIEADCSGAIEFCIPSVARLAGDRLADLLTEDEAEDPGPPTVRFFLDIEPEPAGLTADLRQYAIDELRRMADELNIAAFEIEAGGVR